MKVIRNLIKVVLCTDASMYHYTEIQKQLLFSNPRAGYPSGYADEIGYSKPIVGRYPSTHPHVVCRGEIREDPPTYV